MGICTITVAGNLGRDPKTRDVGDTTVCSFAVAHNRRVKGDDQTDWYNVDAWGKLGELCQQYLAKGRQVVVSGSLAQRTYEKDGEERVSLDIRANDVHFLGSRDDAAAPASEPAGADGAGDDDDDIPF